MPELTIATWAPQAGTEFVLDDPDRSRRLSLRLADVRALGLQPNAPRAEPFALLFAGPEQPLLEQRTYRLEHPVLGALDIFLVPVGPDAAGALCYEAVFN
jgi:hypothetical protein